VSIAHRLGLGLAEDQHLLIPVLQFLLSSGEPFLPAPQGGDRRFEPLSMEWLIIESLGDSSMISSRSR
jgi:hypothetical protein